MADKTKEEELQNKYYQYQMLSEQVKQLQQQAQMLEEQSNELTTAMQGIDELEKTPEKTTLLIPVSQGIFANVQLVDKDNLIVNVGSNIMVRKNMAKTKELTLERLNTVETYQRDTKTNLIELIQTAKQMEKEMKALIGEIKG